jgi:1,4-dihydroxy-2-naphthoyl-CoA synthase
MSAFQTILYDKAGPAATITLNRPEARNGISRSSLLRGRRRCRGALALAGRAAHRARLVLTHKESQAWPKRSSNPSCRSAIRTITSGTSRRAATC